MNNKLLLISHDGFKHTKPMTIYHTFDDLKNLLEWLEDVGPKIEDLTKEQQNDIIHATGKKVFKRGPVEGWWKVKSIPHGYDK